MAIGQYETPGVEGSNVGVKDAGARSREFGRKLRWALGTPGAVLVVFACSKEPASTAPALSATPLEQPAKSSDPAPAKGASASDLCGALCARSRELACAKQAECGKLCAEMVAMPACGSQLVAALACFGSRPASDWECDPDGIAAIKDGFCEGEQARFASCLEHATP
jgi:hypothetical protein